MSRCLLALLVLCAATAHGLELAATYNTVLLKGSARYSYGTTTITSGGGPTVWQGNYRDQSDPATVRITIATTAVTVTQTFAGNWINTLVGTYNTTTGVMSGTWTDNQRPQGSGTWTMTPPSPPPPTNQPPTVACSAAVGPTGGTITATATDPEGQTLSYQWTVSQQPSGAHAVIAAPTAAASNVTVDRAGSYQFRVQVTDGVNQVAAVCSLVVVAVPTRITVTPATVSVGLSGMLSMQAAVADQFGQPVTAAVTWSVQAGGVGGTVTSTGIYQAPDVAGTDTVIARLQAVMGTCVVTVDASFPRITSAIARTRDATTVDLNVVATDPSGGLLSYAWRVLEAPAGPAPIIADATAASTQVELHRSGRYTFLVTVGNGRAQVEQAISAEQAAVVSSLSVTPAEIRLQIDEHVACVALVQDQFGQAAPVTWSVVAGGPGGTITATGDYHAPMRAGSEAILARAGTLERTIPVTVVAEQGGHTVLLGGDGGGQGCGVGGATALLAGWVLMLAARSRR